MGDCCKKGFSWGGSPTGSETKIASNDSYVTGSNKDVAIMIIHDVFGWKFNNLRLLADHFAKEANATVYLPDFFAGEDLRPILADPAKAQAFNIPEFIGRNSKELRFPEMEKVVKEIRAKGFKKIGAIGYCYGGWAVFQLGSKTNHLVDAISMAHPSIVTKDEIDAVHVPVQIMAPESDYQFTPEMKAYANEKIPTLSVPYEYVFFPGVAHGFAVKGDEKDATQKEALERAKNCAVTFFNEFLHNES